MMNINKDFVDQLLLCAATNPRLRQNYDLRTSPHDTSQRMLNALLPGTKVPIHRHEGTTETVVCLFGRIDEVIMEKVVSYETDTFTELPQGLGAQDTVRREAYREVGRISLCPAEGRYGCQIPQGAWHTVEVLEPSVIFEAKDGAYKG